MRVYVDVYDASGTNRLGAGPVVAVKSASVTRALDGPGTFTLNIVGTDQRALLLMTNKRRVKIYTDNVDVGNFRLMGEGIIESVKFQATGGGFDLSVTGLDLLSLLNQKNTLIGRTYNNQLPTDIAAALAALAGFSVSASGGNATSVRYDGQSALKALQDLCAQQGLHFRLSNSINTIEVSTLGAVSGYRVIRASRAESDLYDNDRVLIVDQLEFALDTKDIVNWIIPLGGGEGTAALTLQNSTRTTPYTIQVATGPDSHNYYYLTDGSSVGTYGQIERIIAFKDIVPLSSSAGDIQNAANTLYDAAVSHLQRYKTSLEVYALTVRKVRTTIRPGDKIRVRWQGVVTRDGAPYTYKNIDQDMWVLEATEYIGTGGATLTLKVASVDRYEQSSAEKIVTTMQKVERLELASNSTTLSDPAVTGSGTVTSVAVTAPSDILSVTGSPVTGAGTIALGKQNQNANLVLAGPTTGSPAVPTFRSLVAADLPAGVNGTVDLTGTAGENLSARDAVYLRVSDGKWYKIDIDATGPVLCGVQRGFATGAITINTTGTIRVFGSLSGFGGLTIGDDIWATTTAGGTTQVKPTISGAAAQRAIVRLGFATAADTVFVVPSPVQFVKRDSLANNGTITIEHYLDELARSRKTLAYISNTTGGTIASYSSANHDQGVPLRGGTGSGSTTTPYSGTADGQGIGGVSSGQDWAWGQSFQITAGTLTQFTFNLRANTGTPTGTLTWQICADSGSAPGTVLATGTLTPTASATNTVAVPDGLFLAASTTYWLVLKSTSAQSNGNYWSWYASTSSAYASGNASLSTNGGSSWSALSTVDMACSITTVATTPFDRLAQSFNVGSTSTVDYATLYLRKFGTPTGTLTLRIETDSAGAPSGTLAHANATVNVSESSLSTSYSNLTFGFTDFSLSSGTYWLVLSTDRTASSSNYVVWGADGSSPGYASGNLSTYSGSYSADTGRDMIFSVEGPTTTYEEPCTVGRDSGGTRDVAVKYTDGSGSNPDTNSTFKNVTGATIDLTCVVELT